MLKIGLTGGIASGKSTVGEMFVKRGAHLLQADAIAHSLMEPDRPVYTEIVRHFGTGILNPDRSINRSRLAEAAFGKASQPADLAAARVQELNAIVHPAVIAYENEWMAEIGANHRKAIAIVEAALILEAGSEGRFDALIVVTCTPEQRIQRFARRHGLSEGAAQDEVTRRMAAQLPDEKKVGAADFVIDNSGSIASTEQQVERVFSALQGKMQNGPR